MNRNLVMMGVIAASVFGQQENPDKRLSNAASAFQELMEAPDKGISQDLFDKARCIIIVPDLIKGAFGVGGKYGRGFAFCRQGVHGWSSPAAIAIEGGSFGLQLGGSSTDVVMLVMNESGMNRLLLDKFTIGGEAAAAAGPVGRQTSANTDALLRAEMLSWSRARGVFAGLSLEGATLRPDQKENAKLYGHDVSNKEILVTGVATPGGARPLVAILNRYSGAVTAGAATTHIDTEPLREPGGRIILSDSDIHFATNQWAVPPEAEGKLADVAKVLDENPSWRLHVEGYTDNVGNKTANQRLSQQRATSVLNWLVDHGIDPKRLKATGFGESSPVGNNSSEAGRAQNRRVELLRQ